MLEPQILQEFENYFIIYKPRGWFIHSPSDKRAQKNFREKILTHWLKKTLQRKYYPVHRLDFGTEGIILWAKSPEAAAELAQLNNAGDLKKTYQAVTRGFFEPREGLIDWPLLSDHAVNEKECVTAFKTLKRLELPVQINSNFATSRYSLMEVTLHTGRWHQIRRHFDRVAHPIIGDQEHGDSHHNRYFRDELHLPGLLLKAHSLELKDPWTNDRVIYLCPETEIWKGVYKRFEHTENFS